MAGVLLLPERGGVAWCARETVAAACRAVGGIPGGSPRGGDVTGETHLIGDARGEHPSDACGATGRVVSIDASKAVASSLSLSADGPAASTAPRDGVVRPPSAAEEEPPRRIPRGGPAPRVRLVSSSIDGAVDAADGCLDGGAGPNRFFLGEFLRMGTSCPPTPPRRPPSVPRLDAMSPPMDAGWMEDGAGAAADGAGLDGGVVRPTGVGRPMTFTPGLAG